MQTLFCVGLLLRCVDLLDTVDDGSIHPGGTELTARVPPGLAAEIDRIAVPAGS